jgi:3-hydroxy acid dehydrogenase / malonic semialdehyde reductase
VGALSILTDFELTNKTVLVAGASSGIGRATVVALAELGAKVIIGGRSIDRLTTLSNELGDQCIALDLDVTDATSTETLLERLPAAWRSIHGLVVCAGHDIGGRAAFHTASADDWAGIIDTNVTGTIRVCRAVIEGMLEREAGHIVTLGSVSGYKTYEGGSIYAASKFAIRAFTDSLCLDYRDTDLRVTEILPGMVKTEFAMRRFHGDANKAEAFYNTRPANLTPEAVARTIVWAMQQPPEVNISSIVVQPTRNKG